MPDDLILIVEDEPSIAEVVGLYLERLVIESFLHRMALKLKTKLRPHHLT